MYVITATRESNYTWQNDRRNITITWKGHFENQLHQEQGFLNAIEPSPNHQPNYTIRNIFDDHEGQRQLHGTRNWNGIIRYKYTKSYSNILPEHPSWTDIEKETLTVHVDENVAQMSVWVVAYDIMGRNRMDHVTIFFDETTPILIKKSVQVQKNTKDHDSTFMYSTR